MSESKKHHYVPQVMLRRFNAGKNQILVFDKERNAKYKSSIVDAGCENHFNTFEVDGKRINFEHVFQKLDDDFSTIQEKLLDERNTNCLTVDDRECLLHIIAVQILRTGLQRTTFQSIAEQLQEVLEKTYGSGSNVSIPSDNESRKSALISLMDAEELVGAMRDKQTVLLDAGEEEFVISDNPIALHNSLPYGLTGLSSPGAEIYLPLDPKTTLALYCPTILRQMKIVSQSNIQSDEAKICGNVLDGSKSGAPASLGEETAAFLNSLQAQQSARFVYGPSEASLEVVLGKQSARTLHSVQKSRVSIGEMGKAPSASRMPCGEWVVFYTEDDHGMLPVSDVSEGNTLVCRAAKDGATGNLVSKRYLRQVSLFKDRVETRHMKDVQVIWEEDEIEVVRISFRHRDEALNQILGI